MNIDYNEIGQRIRFKRKELELSQEQVAEAVGVGTSHISHIENGHTKMSVTSLVGICNKLNVSSDFLLGGHIYEAKGILLDETAELLADCSSHEISVINNAIQGLKKAMRSNP